MYSLFCKNLDNYINKYNSNADYRNKVAISLTGLLEPDVYKKYKDNNLEEYYRISHIVYTINYLKDVYHAFQTFSWELWGVGYDAIKNEEIDNLFEADQIELIKLLLGYQYSN